MRCQSGPVHSWHAPCGPSPSTACTKPLTVARSQPLTVCDEVCSRGCVRAQDFWCSEPLSGYREHSLEHTSPSSQLPAMRIGSSCKSGCVCLAACLAVLQQNVRVFPRKSANICSGPLDSTTQTSIPRACGNTHAVLNAVRSSIHFSVIQ